MKTWQWLLYGSLFVVGEYYAFQSYDWAQHNNPTQTYYGLPYLSVFLVPILLILALHILIGMLGQAKPQASELGTPVAYVWVANPTSQERFSQFNPVFDASEEKFLFLVNASRSYKQKHKGERIIAGIRFNDEEKRKFDNTIHHYYVHSDHLSRAEIAKYLLEEGDVFLQDYNYNISFSEYPMLLYSAEVVFYEIRGAPKTIEDLGIALYSAGHGAQAESLLEAAKPEIPYRRR